MHFPSQSDFATTIVCFLEALTDICLLSNETGQRNTVEQQQGKKKKLKNRKYKPNQNNLNGFTANQTRDASEGCKISTERVHVSRSENRAVFTGKHKPHGTGILRVDKHPHTQRQPHAVATTTHDFLTDGVPEQEDREDVMFQTAATVRCACSPPGSPQAAGEGSACIEVEDLGGVALEGVTIRYGCSHSVLEFLVATGNAGTPLQLIGPQRRGQQVGQVVVPHGRELQVLEEGDRVQGLNPRRWDVGS